MQLKQLTVALAAASAASAQRPSNVSICDYYTTALLKNNTAANQLTLLTLIVNTVVIGNCKCGVVYGRVSRLAVSIRFLFLSSCFSVFLLTVFLSLSLLSRCCWCLQSACSHSAAVFTVLLVFGVSGVHYLPSQCFLLTRFRL